MNTVSPSFETAPIAGSIGVYQRLSTGKMPARVQIYRSTYSSTQGTDGRTYGRTNNQYLLSLDSGTLSLSGDMEDALRTLGLSESELRHVNRRLNELASAANAQTLVIERAAAVAAIHRAGDIGAQLPGAREFVLRHLAEAYSGLNDANVPRQPSLAAVAVPDFGAVGVAPVDAPETALLQALQAANAALAHAQTAFRQLQRGQDVSDEVVLEFQRTWFSNQTMVDLLKTRKGFYRPSGWTSLRQQIMVEGRVWRAGDLVPKASAVS